MSPSIASINVPSSGGTKGQVRRYAVLVLCSVLVSIVILVGLMTNPNQGSTLVDEATGDIPVLETNLVRYKTLVGNLPTEAQGLLALTEQPTSEPIPQKWRKFTETSSLIDPWGHPYQYRNPGKRNASSIDVYSFGPDGRDGTKDDIHSVYAR